MDKIVKLKQVCIENKIPILRDETLKLLIKTLKDSSVNNVLEIGSAYGYSAISMGLSGFSVTSLERDINSYNMAISSLGDFKNINVEFINTDALIYKTDKKFDAIFIDAAKSKYEDFFNLYKDNLNDRGIFFFDNFNFAIKNIEEFSKRLQPIAKKMSSFYEKIKETKEYIVNIHKIDDGVLILKKI